MLQIYSTVNDYTVRKINSQAYNKKTYHEGKPLPLGTFVLKRNFSHVRFSDKLKQLRIGPTKILDRLSDVTCKLLSQDGSTFDTHRNHLLLFHPKEPVFYPHLRNFMRFSDSPQYDIRKLIKYANCDSSPFNSDDTLSDDTSSQENFSSSTPNPPSSPLILSPTIYPLMTQDSSELQSLINLMPLIEHVIDLKMTFQSIIIPLTDESKPIKICNTNHEKITDSSYHNPIYSTPDQSLKLS